MSLRYVLGRLLFFFVVVWAGVTLIFFLPRLAQDRDPVRERLGMMVAMGGMNADNIERLAQAYEVKFGLDKPLWQQYVNYLSQCHDLWETADLWAQRGHCEGELFFN